MYTSTQLTPVGLSVQRTDDGITLVNDTDDETTRINFTEMHAVGLWKLLDIGNGQIPEYRFDQFFIFGTAEPELGPIQPGPTIRGDDDSATIEGVNGSVLTLSTTALSALHSALDSYGLTLPEYEYTSIPLPAMRFSEDGINEPTLFEGTDHVVEHYHRSEGYYSPKLERYVSR